MATAQDKKTSQLTTPASIADTDIATGYRPGTGGQANLDIQLPIALVRTLPADAATGRVARTVAAKTGEVPSTTDFGGVDGSSSDFKAVLDRLIINAVPNNHTTMRIDAGVYQLATTWNPSDRSSGGTLLLGQLFRGGTLDGGSGYVGYTPSIAYAEYHAAPQIIWTGSAGGTMIELDTIIGMSFRGLGIFGGNDTDADSTNRCGIQVNISQRGITHGSGGHFFDRCAFADFQTSFRFGEGQAPGVGNCDTTEWHSCTWQNGDRAIHLTHTQNLVYTFSGQTTVFSVKRFFHSELGGYFNIEQLNLRNIGGTGVDDWFFDLKGGTSTGTHRIGPTRLEGTTGCKQFMRIVGSSCDVIIDGFFEAQTDQNVTMFDIMGGQLTLRGGRIVTHDSTNPTFMLRQETASGYSPVLRLIGVMLVDTQFTYADWISHATNCTPRIEMRGCVLANGRSIPDWSTRIETGLPVPLKGSTTTSNTIGLTLLQNNATGRFDNCVAISTGAWRIRMNLMAGLNSGGLMTTIKLVAIRDFSVFNNGSTIVISDTQTIGTDINPDSYVFSLASSDASKHITCMVTGIAATNIFWRAHFTLLSAWPHYGV